MSSTYTNADRRRFLLNTLSTAWLKRNNPSLWKRFEDYAFKKFPGKRKAVRDGDEWLAEALGKGKR
jgi:hypothetical protein